MHDVQQRHACSTILTYALCQTVYTIVTLCMHLECLLGATLQQGPLSVKQQMGYQGQTQE
jgi:hypothetical protein